MHPTLLFCIRYFLPVSMHRFDKELPSRIRLICCIDSQPSFQYQRLILCCLFAMLISVPAKNCQEIVHIYHRPYRVWLVFLINTPYLFYRLHFPKIFVPAQMQYTQRGNQVCHNTALPLSLMHCLSLWYSSTCWIVRELPQQGSRLGEILRDELLW